MGIITFGQRVHGLRKLRGWTLEEFSAKTGLSVSYISEIERDRRDGLRLPLDTVRCLAEHLGFRSLDEFLRPATDGTDTQGDGIIRQLKYAHSEIEKLDGAIKDAERLIRAMMMHREFIDWHPAKDWLKEWGTQS